VNVAAHVGHQVTVTGAPEGVETGAVTDTGMAHDTAMRHEPGMMREPGMAKDAGRRVETAATGGALSVTNLRHVSSRCQ
jgi:hypothetical protein